MRIHSKKSSKKASELREEAESRLKKDALQNENLTQLDLSDPRLVHELQVHQIELELQQQELLEARDLAEIAATRYSNLYDFAPVAYVTLNRAGEINSVNLYCASLLGMTRTKLIGLGLINFVADESLLEFGRFLANSFSEHARVFCEVLLNVNARYVQLNASLCENGIESRVVLTDVTELKQAELNSNLAASVLKNAHEGIMVTDSEGLIIEANDCFVDITGYSREEALGKNPRFLKSGRQSQDFYESMWSTLLKQGRWRGEVWNKRKNGEVFPTMQTISSVSDGDRKIMHYVSLFTDITDQKAHQAQLEHNANFDALTNLPNRTQLAALFTKSMQKMKREGKMIALAYLDLDGFKKVNDRHGHSVGDELLIAISKRLQAVLGAKDILARIGGDEFAVVLMNIDTEHDSKPVLDRLLKAAAEELVINGIVMRVSTSIGVSFYPSNGSDLDLLLRQADQAMYTAKMAGRNGYQFYDLDLETSKRVQRESVDHIRDAFDRNEFVLYYQPKINMKTNALVGVEALIRWQHPEQGILAPDVFLPVIEGHVLSVEMGEWVIETALSQTSAWQEMGLELKVSVNVGASQLQCDDFMLSLNQALIAHPDVKPNQLELEILETSALEDMDDVCLLMQQCLELGITFSLDDFGTGYSSLTYLKQLPASELKIDKSFVQDMLTDPSDLAIVKAVIGLSEIFGRRVIAEGVETVAHAEQLLSLNCEMGQGYGIARPMSAEALFDWANKWQKKPVWAVQ